MTGNSLPTESMRATEPSRVCSYVASETASLEYRVFAELSPREVEILLERGWRRFGRYVFRPACTNCSKCVPIRIDVNRFRASKSQRRALRRNEHISVSVHRPEVTHQHIDLYNRWHEDMTERRGWTLQQSDPREYAQGFLTGRFSCLHEMRYFDGDKLVGIGLLDILPNSISSAYFYHDPDWRSLGPGTFSLLCEIELAQRLELEYLYLGYWIEECPSMAYKNRFHPSDILIGSPDDETTPDWQPYSAES